MQQETPRPAGSAPPSAGSISPNPNSAQPSAGSVRHDPGLPNFEAFLAAELDGLARYARVLTGDRQRAHDVLADALIQATVRWKRIGAMEFPAAYVRRMITTGFLGERRRWSTRHIHPVESPPELPTADPTTTVDDRAALQVALATLPRQQRAAVVLRFYLDLPDDEIAGELGCSVGAVRSYVSRGLAALRIIAAADGRSTSDHSAPASHPAPADHSEPAREQS